jgi:transposase
MYRELQPLRQTLREELGASLLPGLPGIEPDKLLDTYLDQLTLFVGADVADHTLSLLAIDASQEELGHLLNVANTAAGFRQIGTWLDKMRSQRHLRIIAVACEATGVYYWGFWDALAELPNVARILYNPRTTEHMGEVLSKRVRNELVDAYLLAEQLRLGSTPEVILSQDPDLLAARFCSRSARDLAQQINRKKNQLRALLRAYNPAFAQTFPGSKFHHPAVYALFEHHLFPDEIVAAGTEVIAAVLTSHCQTAFDATQAQLLVDLSRSVLLRPIQRPVIRRRVLDLADEITTAASRQRYFIRQGYDLIKQRPEAKLLKQTTGAGLSNTLALVSEIGDVQRFPDGEHLASFLGLTTSKHISGTTVYKGKHITKQGAPNARYAVVNMADHLRHKVPFYNTMYQRIAGRKSPHQGHFVALVAIARHFTTNVLYDMWRYQRPFFLETTDYRQFLKEHPHTTH